MEESGNTMSEKGTTMTTTTHLQGTLSAGRPRTGHAAPLFTGGVEAFLKRLRDSLRRSRATAAEIDQSLDRRNEDLRQLMAVHTPRVL